MYCDYFQLYALLSLLQPKSQGLPLWLDLTLKILSGLALPAAAGYITYYFSNSQKDLSNKNFKYQIFLKRYELYQKILHSLAFYEKFENYIPSPAAIEPDLNEILNNSLIFSLGIFEKSKQLSTYVYSNARIKAADRNKYYVELHTQLKDISEDMSTCLTEMSMGMLP